MQKISKKHYWLRQIRRPLCLALIVLIVFCHGFISNAETTTETVNERYNNEETNLPVWGYDTMKTVWSQNGGDISKLTYGGGYYGGSRVNLNTQIFNNDNSKAVLTWNINGVDIDFSNKYISMAQDSTTNTLIYQLYFVGNGRFALVNDYYVSDEPFIIYTFNSYLNNGVIEYRNWIGAINASVISGTSLYGYQIRNYNGYGLQFTDLNVYMSTSDGSSGFTSLNDFSFDGDNYNFNYLKTQDYIISPADPEPEPEQLTIGQHYTYAGIDAYFTDGSASSVILNYNISPNEYMRLHPYEYDVNFRFYAVIVTNDTEHPNIRLTYSYNTMQGAEMAINNNRNYTRIQLSFDQLESNEGYNLADALKSWWGGVTGASENYYNENGSVISFGGQSMNDASRSFGGYRLNPNLKIEDIYFGCRIYIQCNAVEPKQDSGVYEFGQYLISGERKQQLNTISQNMNPPEIYDPQYPAQLTDGNGNTIVNGTPVNTYLYNNLQAMVEHLFNIDASDINNIGGNMHNMYQGLVTELSNTSQSGFWGVLKQTYTFIPDEIWDWIKIVVGFLLGGTVVGWAYNGWRIKGR